jgi:hypothetical protein
MRTIRFHPQAQIEMVASAKYYEAEQEGLGKRFLEAVNAATRRASLYPVHLPGRRGTPPGSVECPSPHWS